MPKAKPARVKPTEPPSSNQLSFIVRLCHTPAFEVRSLPGFRGHMLKLFQSVYQEGNSKFSESVRKELIPELKRVWREAGLNHKEIEKSLSVLEKSFEIVTSDSELLNKSAASLNDFSNKLPLAFESTILPVFKAAIFNTNQNASNEKDSQRAKLRKSITSKYPALKQILDQPKREKTGGRTPPQNIKDLPLHYGRLAPEVGKAKEWVADRFDKWKTHPPENGWKAAVRDTYPALCTLDDDLIERLSPDPKLPQDVLDLIGEKDHDTSAPSNIALEAAARLCGCRPYKYARGSLFRLLGQNGSAH
jgi:hypothetical protein